MSAAPPHAKRTKKERAPSYWFTRAYLLRVEDTEFDEPEPVYGFRPSINDPPGHWDAYQEGWDQKHEWDRKRYKNLYCSAIVKRESQSTVDGQSIFHDVKYTAFVDYSLVHGGWGHPVEGFTKERYPLQEDKPHLVVVTDLGPEDRGVNGLRSYINVTRDWRTFEAEVQAEISACAKRLAAGVGSDDPEIKRMLETCDPPPSFQALSNLLQ